MTTTTRSQAAAVDRRGDAPTRSRAWMMTLGFVVVSFALAFWQKPGWTSADTKIDLHVDPGQFLRSVLSVWTPTTDLGEVHAAQYSGYVWPMGSFFAVFHALGLSPWVIERIWLGLLFALSTWGMLRLMDLLVGRPRGVAHLAAAAFVLFNPYVTVFTARTSITLLGYAALPWLLLVTYHGVQATRGWRGWRSWWWAAAFALILTSTGGGVNAAVVGWMLVGPLVMLIYQPAIGDARWRDAGGYLLRVGILGVLGSLWWIVPLLVHVRFGIDFLQFTEQPATIWGTNSLTESLRLMGYWTSYIGVGFGINRAFFSDGGTLLFNPLVVGASLLLPALAVAGFVRARRLSYAPFLLLLIVVGVVIETAGFPDGTPIRGTMEWLYQHIFVLRFMRTTNKAAPLVAVGVAGLLGLGARQLLGWLRGLPASTLRRAALVAAPLAFAGLLVLAALPLVRGGAIDTQLSYKRIPSAWTQAGAGLNRNLAANTRALVLPGQIFAFYKWGGTLDAILPRLTSRPVAVRYETPYSDLHAVDLLTTVDDLVQQNRLVPGELKPLLALMGVGAVVTGTDDDLSRSGALDPVAAARILAAQGLNRPSDSYGPVHSFSATGGDIGAGAALPQVRRYNLTGARGIVHVDPSAPASVVDGSAQTLADMAAFGTLPAHNPILYAGDLSAAQIRAQAAAGANLVVGDSNRRRQFLPQSAQQNSGATVGQNISLQTGAAIINPFASAGSAGQTVSALQGARYLRAPLDPGELQFPETAPISAFDGNLSTAWVADSVLPPADRWIQIGFTAPRDVPYVDLYPLDDQHGTVTEVDVNGIPHAMKPGWNRVPVHLRHVSALRITIDHVTIPKVGKGGAGGFREIRIPGFHVRELLRPPIVVGRDLAGANLSHNSLTYLFERTTGDDPFQRNAFGVTTLMTDPQDRGDAEAQIDRILFAPAARAYDVDAWVYPAITTPDSALDRLAGYRGADRFDSSSRFQDQPAYRASSAFDGSAGPGWIGVWNPTDASPPWISWSTSRRLRFSQLRLTPSSLLVRRPTEVQLSWPGGATGALPVGASGTVTLPRPVAAYRFRLTVLDAGFPAGATNAERQARAVGIGSVTVPGVAAVRIPTSGRLQAGCGSVAIQAGARRVALQPVGIVAQLDAGQPLPARTCGGGGRLQLGAGVQEVKSLPGTFSVDLLRLTSRAPAPVPAPVSGGTVTDPGKINNSSVTGVRVSLRGPSWVVLGESFDAGWRASCNGRSLGLPQVVDGYGNGWLAPASCTRVSFTFSPQSGVEKSYLVSAIVGALMVLFLLIGAFRQPVRDSFRAAGRLLPAAHPRRWPLPWALGLALLAAVPLAYMFALRAGAALFFLVAFVLWRGYGPKQLVLAAAALLGIAVPIIYLISQPANKGGYNFAYSTQTIWAHWTGVAAIVLLMLALWQIIRARTR